MKRCRNAETSKPSRHTHTQIQMQRQVITHRDPCASGLCYNTHYNSYVFMTLRASCLPDAAGDVCKSPCYVCCVILLGDVLEVVHFETIIFRCWPPPEVLWGFFSSLLYGFTVVTLNWPGLFSFFFLPNSFLKDNFKMSFWCRLMFSCSFWPAISYKIPILLK